VTVRQKYTQAAEAATRREFKQARAIESQSGADDLYCCSPADQTGVVGDALYDEARAEEVPELFRLKPLELRDEEVSETGSMLRGRSRLGGSFACPPWQTRICSPLRGVYGSCP
jgi:phage FluMu gp28-like protein